MLKQRQIAIVLGVIFCLVVICTGTEEETDRQLDQCDDIYSRNFTTIIFVVLPSYPSSIHCRPAKE